MISIKVQYPLLHIASDLLTRLGCTFISVTGRQPHEEEFRFATGDGHVVNVFQQEGAREVSPQESVTLTFSVENPQAVAQAIDADMGRFLTSKDAITTYGENGFTLKVCFMPCQIRLVPIPATRLRQRREGDIVERDNDLLP